MTSAAPIDSRPVGRLAPSPTGLLHLGHARSFLLAWWQVRASGGVMRLRIEDLDRDRSRPEWIETCVRDLEWLGLDWDGEPLLQSSDTSAMERACDSLLAAGRAYPCVCSRAEIAALSAPHAGDLEPRYPGTCRGKWQSLAQARAATGKDAGVRLLVADGEIEIDDGVAGRVRCDVQREVGDFLIRRRDGAFAYQLAVVVDDSRTGVDTILRGADLLPSAARQWHVQTALELPHPRWFHVPLVVDESGERLAKRRGDLALSHLREIGVDPRAVVAWAARVSGQGAIERARAREVLERFDLSRLTRENVRLTRADCEELMRTRAGHGADPPSSRA
jgi:glutamyl-tRNA synthetase